MKQIQQTAFITNTSAKSFVKDVNRIIRDYQEQGYQVEINYTATTPFQANTEYQAFIIARGD